MMWTHHQDRVLRSADADGSGGGGAPPASSQGVPPVAQPQGQPQAAGEYVPRSMFEDAVKTRQAAKDRERDALARLEQLERENAELRQARQPKPPETTNNQPAPDGAADQLRERLERLEAQEKAKAQADRQRTLTERIAAQVPDARHHGLIPTIISGLHPSGLPDGELDAIASTLLTTLKGQYPSLFEPPPGSPRTALQKGPTGQIDWSQVQSRADIPPGTPVPPEVYARLRTQNQGDTGMILGSKPAPRPST